mmetsp:Transcript_26067/g.98170  ORF Transcript_26067/g.98170 Transcript_26067/m.98170 type:complete len:231 (-) Transcript_26067:348-1040(-)
MSALFRGSPTRRHAGAALQRPSRHVTLTASWGRCRLWRSRRRRQRGSTGTRRSSPEAFPALPTARQRDSPAFSRPRKQHRSETGRPPLRSLALLLPPVLEPARVRATTRTARLPTCPRTRRCLSPAWRTTQRTWRGWRATLAAPARWGWSWSRTPALTSCRPRQMAAGAFAGCRSGLGRSQRSSTALPPRGRVRLWGCVRRWRACLRTRAAATPGCGFAARLTPSEPTLA